MIEVIFLLILALIWIIFATVQDLRSREVANWLNFSLIIFAIGFRFFFGLFSDNGFGLFYQGLIGLGIFFVLGNMFYYGRIFAGGDAKLLMALGTILPLSGSFMINLQYFFSFFILFLISGTIYGIIWSIFLMIKSFKEFKKEFSRQFLKLRKISIISVIVGIFFLISAFYLGILFLYLSLVFFVFPLLFVYSKTIDEACMIKTVNVGKLTEGDWLYNDIKIGKKTIKTSWDGLTKNEIAVIRKKLKTVRIRQGIPFVPVFLIAFVIFSYGILFGSQISTFFTGFFS